MLPRSAQGFDSTSIIGGLDHSRFTPLCMMRILGFNFEVEATVNE